MFDAPRRVTLFDSGWSCFQHDRSVKSVGAIALSVQKYPDSRGICQTVMFGRSDMSAVRLFNGTATFADVMFPGGGA